jgi:hypothetical protein
MKLILTTIFDGMDEQWLKWYCERLKKSGLPDQIRAAISLEQGQPYSFTSSINPTDLKCSATTSYRLEK